MERDRLVGLACRRLAGLIGAPGRRQALAGSILVFGVAIFTVGLSPMLALAAVAISAPAPVQTAIARPSA